MRAGDTETGRRLRRQQRSHEGKSTRTRYMGGEGHGGGSVATVRELPDGSVTVWCNGFRVHTHASLAEFFERWRVTAGDLRETP